MVTTPVDDSYYLYIRIRYSFSASDEEALNKLETILSSAIEKPVNQIKVSPVETILC